MTSHFSSLYPVSNFPTGNSAILKATEHDQTKKDIKANEFKCEALALLDWESDGFVPSFIQVRADANLVPRPLVDEAEGKIRSNPICTRDSLSGMCQSMKERKLEINPQF